MKKSNDTIGNRTRDLPACSAVPQKGKYTVDNRSLNVLREERLHIPLRKDRGSQDAHFSF
jgi:hypothetical protein